MERPDVQGIIDQVLAGDRDAFRRLVKVYSLPLRSFLCSQVHHMEDADDLAQETFLSAYKNLSTFRRGEDFGAWLRGIARNKVQNFFRSSGRRNSAINRFREQVATVAGDDLDASTATDSSEMVERLLQCVSKLPDRLRRVVRAGLDGDKPAKTAQEMNTTVGAVYNLHWRANQLLRQCVSQELQEPA